ncbi:MAG TPA: efflux RND transporter periplasmic adaptor subunit [Lacunisphaera sp.]|jgi:RND family efflux transporter MFP subunit
MSTPKPSPANWVLRLAVVIVAAVVIYYIVSYFTRPVAFVQPVTLGKSVSWVPGTVEVKAEFDGELKSDVSGRVKSSELEIGKHVFKNEALIQIDTADVDLEIERLKNEITAARKKVELGSTFRASVLNSKDTLDNLERQMKAGSYPAGEFAKQQRLHQQLEQTMELDETNNKLLLANWENSLRSKELEKSKMTITAPADGVITAVLARIGDLIDRNTSIADFIAVGRTVEGKLSEENFKGVTVGQKATVRFLTYGNDQYNAVITKVLPSADPTTLRYSVYLNVAMPEGHVLVPGTTGEMTIILAQRDNALLIPTRALVDKYVLNGKKVEYVYVLNGNKVELREVGKGYGSMNLTEITSGLKEGELVITDQQDRFREGERVKTQIVPE